MMHFEDFSVGWQVALGPIVVTRDAVLAFAQDFDPQPFHLDDEAARTGPFGALTASGWHTCGMIMRVVCDAFLNNAAGRGSPGVDRIQWKNPVFVGDILSGTFEVQQMRKSASRPGIGILHYIAAVHDQHGTPKAEFQGPFFMQTRT